MKSFYTVMGVLFGLILTAIGVVYALYVYNNHSSAVAFQQYEPQHLPDGLQAERRVVEIWKNPANLLAPNKLLRIHTADKNLTIGEEAYNGYAYNCSQVATNATCSINETPKGQKYELTTTVQYESPNNTPIGQDVRLRKDNTHIWVNVTGNPSKIYSKTSWDTLIDSLAPMSYKNLPTEHYSPGL